MNKNPLLQLIAITLLLLAASSTMAAMYKWVDDEGNIHYSQTPPMERQSEQIEKPRMPAPPPKADAAPADTTTAEPTAGTESEGPSEEEIRAEKERVAEECRRARQWISEIENKPRLRVRDDSGNLRYLTEEERQARLKQAQDYLRKYCN